MVSVIVRILDLYDRVRREWSKRLEKEGININDYKALGAYLKTQWDSSRFKSNNLI